MDAKDLKAQILSNEPREFVEQYVIGGECAHFTKDKIEIIRRKITRATGIEIKADEIQVVGSAKLGYGLFDKQ